MVPTWAVPDLLIVSEYRCMRKSLYTSIVAGTVKLYRYNRNIVINVIVINGVQCSFFLSALAAIIFSSFKIKPYLADSFSNVDRYCSRAAD